MSGLCRLEVAIGQSNPCPAGACPFWELGGAVFEGHCAFERLDLIGRRDVVNELLSIRSALELSAIERAEQAVRRRFYRLLNQSPDD